MIHVASGPAVVRVSAQGTVLSALPLAGLACTAPSVLADRVVVGCAGPVAGTGVLQVFAAGKLLWSSPLASPPTAVCVGQAAIYAAAGNGALAAFAP